jgi:hypothetical protein
MNKQEQELEQIRKERVELEKFKKGILSLIDEIKADKSYSPKKCAVIIKDLERKLDECTKKHKDGKNGSGGSVYEQLFDKPKQDSEEEEAIRKKKLEASKKNGGYKPQM